MNRSVAPEGNLVNALETKKKEGKIKEGGWERGEKKKKSDRDDEFFLSAITDTVKRE